MATKTVKVVVAGEDKLSPVLAKAEGQAGSFVSTVKSHFARLNGALAGSGLFAGFQEAIGPISEGLGALATKAHSVGEKIAGVGVAGAGIGAGLLAASSNQVQALGQLKAAISAAGGSYADYKDQIEHTVKTQQNYGHSTSDTLNALQVLTSSTGSADLAMKYMNVTANLAASQHLSLADAANQVARILGGSGTRTLIQYGIHQVAATVQAKALATAQAAVAKAHLTLDKATATVSSSQLKLTQLEEIDHQKKKLTLQDQFALQAARANVSKAIAAQQQAQVGLVGAEDKAKAMSVQHTSAIDQLSKKLNGQARASVSGFTGQLKVLSVKVQEQVADFGQKYGPAITAAGAGLTVLGSAAAGAKSIMGALGDTSKVAAAGQELLSGAADATAASETAAGVAGDAAAPGIMATVGPVLLIIAAVALLVVGIYELVKHWKEVWGFIKEIVSDAINFIRDHWQLILAILLGPIGLAVLFIKDHFQQIIGFVAGVVDWVKGHWRLLLDILTGPFGLAFNFISQHFNQIVAIVTGIPGRIATAATGMWDGIKDGFKAAIDFIIGLWNDLAGLTSFNLPKINVGPVHLGGEHIGPVLPTIPLLDTGALVTRPTIAMLAGNSRPEAVLTMPQLAALAGTGGGGKSKAKDVTNYNEFNFNTQADPAEISRETTWALARIVS